MCIIFGFAETWISQDERLGTMCIIFGFAETWISQDERLGTMCRFVAAKTKLRKPILREGSFELLSSNFKQRRNDEFFFSHCV